MFTTYSKLLVQRPFLTNSITSCCIMMFGDTISQSFLENKVHHDYERTIRFGSYGLLIQAPIVRFWYLFLEKSFPSKTLKSSLKKLICDQIIFGPFIHVIGISSIEFLKTRSIDNVKEALYKNYKDVVMNAYKVWPLAQFVNFFLIPFKFRILFGSMVALFWNTYFTWKVNH